MTKLQIFKDVYEKIIREQENKFELIAILLQRLCNIQRELKYGPTTSDIEIPQSKKTQIPP